MCIPCDAPFTIKHILLYCVDFETARNRYYRVSTLKELSESVEISNIFSVSESNWFINQIIDSKCVFDL